jgi:hypothetical protein
MDNTLLVLLLWALVGALIGAAIGNHKGRTEAGAFFGFLLGPIGWLIVAVGPSMKPKCPDCGGEVVPGARKCKNCGAELAIAGS